MNRTIFTAAIIAFIAIVSLSVTAVAGPVPDTGQTKCYDDNQEIPCPQPGQPFYGQDSQYSTNPHSYTDLGNGIIRDNVTGLMWQKDTAPGTYTWDQSNTYCADLTLGGYSDWRLPTIKELSYLVDSSIPYPGPTINTTYFPGTQASYYWSSTTSAPVPGEAWFVSFGSGLVNTYGKSYNGYYVRAVRGGTTNNPPVIGPITVNPNPVNEGNPTSLIFTATDIDGDEMDYSWTCLNTAPPTGGDVVAGNNISTYNAPYIISNSAEICTLTVIDAKGSSVSKQVIIYIKAARNPNCDNDGIKEAGEMCDGSDVDCPAGYGCDDCQCIDYRWW